MTIALEEYIHTIPDFPEPGVLFRDMSPLLADPAAFTEAIRQMKAYWEDKGITKLGAFDARGFLFAGALAYAMHIPFFMLRKKGKLPGKTVSLPYGLEYATAVLEMSENAVGAMDKVLLVDDVLATGGTATAGALLIESQKATVSGLAVLMEITSLGGRQKFGRGVHALITY